MFLLENKKVFPIWYYEYIYRAMEEIDWNKEYFIHSYAYKWGTCM